MENGKTPWIPSLEFNGLGLASMSPYISNNEASTYTKCKLAVLHINKKIWYFDSLSKVTKFLWKCKNLWHLTLLSNVS